MPATEPFSVARSQGFSEPPEPFRVYTAPVTMAAKEYDRALAAYKRVGTLTAFRDLEKAFRELLYGDPELIPLSPDPNNRGGADRE